MIQHERSHLQIDHTDIKCIYCGYDLTGATIGGQCPECGGQVSYSLITKGKPTNGYAIASLILGICSIILCCGPGVVCGLLGLTLGSIAMRQQRSFQYDPKSRGMAIAGLMCSSVGLILFFWFIITYL